MGKNSFLPDNFEMPQSGGGDNYMKFSDGETRFRIISKPIFGFLGWDGENKPHRFKMGDTYDAKAFREKPKYFWAMIVWNYDKARPQVLEITQRSVIDEIVKLNNDAEWGAPWGYDIKVSRSGQKLETKYSVVPSPKKPISKEIKENAAEWKIELSNLYTNDDPFVEVPKSYQAATDEKPSAEQQIVDSSDDDGDDDLPF